MYLVRNVFRARPGHARPLVEKFKAAAPHLEKLRPVKSMRVLTDVVAGFWTVVIESEVEDLAAYIEMARGVTSSPTVAEIMKGYMDHVETGHREVFVIE